VKLKNIFVEGRYDGIVTYLSQGIINSMKKGDRDIYDFVDVLGNEIEVNVEIIRNKKLPILFVINGGALDVEKGSENKCNEIELEIIINPNFYPRGYTELIPELKDVLRHEIEHITQVYIANKPNVLDPKKVKKKINLKPVKQRKMYSLLAYLLQPGEIQAFWSGFLAHSKSKRIAIDDVMDGYLEKNVKGALPQDKYDKVRRVWLMYGKKKYKNVKWRN